MAGLDEKGLTIKRLPEVLEDIVELEREEIDPDISTRDDELLGQLNTIFSSVIAENWELAQAVNDSANVLKAEGKNLDDQGALTLTRRQSGSKSSTISQRFVGDDGSVVFSGAVLQNPSTLDRFIVPQDVEISSDSCIKAVIKVQTVSDSTVYSLSVNTEDYSITSDSDATSVEILQALETTIDADSTKTWEVEVNTTEETLTITTSDSNTIDVSLTTLLVVSSVEVAGKVEAEEEGDITVPSNAVTTILSSVSGLESTYNPEAYVLGRERETDEDYRKRILLSQQSSGKATLEAIRSQILNVTGVTTVLVVENDQNTVDSNGIPAKSFETVVQGGASEDIAQAIWDSKPAGISTFGSSTENITYNGIQYSVLFTRPSSVNLAVLVEYSTYDEESFPANGASVISDAVLNFINNLEVNEDVIPKRALGSIYSSVNGINDLTVSIQQITSSGDPVVSANWQTDKLAVNFKQFANTTSSDITVTEV